MASHDWSSRYGNVVYHQHGLGDPVLLVHGIYVGASHEEWEHNIRALAQHFTVYAIDLVGFGESHAPRMTYTGQMMADVLRAFVVEVIGSPTHLIASGVSCGVATRLAVFDDLLVNKLVLIDPSTEAAPDDGPGMMERLRQFLLGTLQMGSGLYDTLASEAELRLFLVEQYALSRHLTRSKLEQLYTNAHRPDSLYGYVSWLCGHFNLDVFRWLRYVRSDTLILWGQETGPAPFERITANPTWSRGKRMEIIEHAKHWPHDEQSAKVNHLLLTFLGVSVGTAV